MVWDDNPAARKVATTFGFSAHRNEGDKIVAFCDCNCNVIAPFVRSSRASNDRRCCAKLAAVIRIAHCDWLDLQGAIVAGCSMIAENRKAFYKSRHDTNINANPAVVEKSPSEAPPQPLFARSIIQKSDSIH